MATISPHIKQFKGLEAKLKQLSSSKADLITSKSLNRTITTLRAESTPLVIKEMQDAGLDAGITNTGLKRELEIKKSTVKRCHQFKLRAFAAHIIQST